MSVSVALVDGPIDPSRELARFGAANQGTQPAGPRSGGPLEPGARNSIAPAGVQKRMRVMAFTTTRRRSQPTRSSRHDWGSEPHMLARKSR